jgi:RNA polymerase sigma-B factor
VCDPETLATHSRSCADIAGAAKPEVPSKHGDEYSDVPSMFRTLRALPVESPDFARQRERIVARCLPLAEHVARRYDRRGESLDDLIQVARVGLVKAINRYDPDTGPFFVAYAVPTMMGEVRRHFRDNAWTMHVPRRLKELHSQITKATTTLAQTLGREPTVSELAEALDADRDEVVEAMVAAHAYVVRSIDIRADGDGQRGAGADTLAQLDAGIELITEREMVRSVLATLSNRERTVLTLRYFAGMTQSEIAERVGVSQMYVSRILASTLAQLRQELSA